jgi:toxin-antitoxin system PIN domain toxin
MPRRWSGWAERGSREALLCRSTQQSFLRLLSTRAVLAPYRIPPLSNKAAWSVYEGLLADERIAWVEEPSGLETSWKKFAAGSKASPKLWMDAYLAAFAMAGGHQLVTTDKGFKQFKGLDLLVLSSKG